MSDTIQPSKTFQTVDTKDLGFGRRVTQQKRTRFLNRDGSFNVIRHGTTFWRSLNIYHALLTVSWPRFFALMISFYFLLNLSFGSAYFLCGPEALRGAVGDSVQERWFNGFFFSVQTLSTIGYGGISPHGMAANGLVTLESLIGLLYFAIATGIIFARFSRPVAHILFSDTAIVAPYQDKTAFEFRIVNALKNQLMDIQAQVIFSRKININGQWVRRFEPLALERPSVTFFPLQWTVAHPIDENSPLYGMGARELEESDAEFIILLTGFDETFSQTVHTRSSYKYSEVVFGAKYADMYVNIDDEMVQIDMGKLSEIERVAKQ